MSDNLLTCCICLKFFQDECGIGNNPRPVKAEGSCCDDCNASVVLPERLKIMETGEYNPLWQPMKLNYSKAVKVSVH